MKKLFASCLALIIATLLCACNNGENGSISQDNTIPDESTSIEQTKEVTGIESVDFWVTEKTESGLRYSMSVGNSKAVIEVTLATDHDAQWYYEQDITTYTLNDQMFLEGESVYGSYTYKTIRTDSANPKLYTDSSDGTTIIVELNDYVDISRDDVKTILASFDTK